MTPREPTLNVNQATKERKNETKARDQRSWHEMWNNIELLPKQEVLGRLARAIASLAMCGGDGDYRVQKFTFPFLKAGAFWTALSHCCGTFSSSVVCVIVIQGKTIWKEAPKIE